MNKSTLQKMVITGVVLVALAVALFFLTKSHTPSSPALEIDTKDQPTRGNPAAKVHIVVFEDLKCVACRNFNNTVLPQIKSEYIDKGLAKYTVINVAFIPGSMPAANAARCLYNENPDWFFTFVDYVYQNQPPENEDWATIPKLVEFAKVIPGVDSEKLSRCIYESPHTAFIENNFKQASKLQGASVATPAVYVNGHVVNTPNITNIRKAVDAEK
jgi:protein-disulfide isomerase